MGCETTIILLCVHHFIEMNIYLSSGSWNLLLYCGQEQYHLVPVSLQIRCKLHLSVWLLFLADLSVKLVSDSIREALKSTNILIHDLLNVDMSILIARQVSQLLFSHDNWLPSNFDVLNNFFNPFNGEELAMVFHIMIYRSH